MTLSGALETLNNPIGGLASNAATTASTLVLQGISSWVLGGTAGALREVAAVIGAATAPNLTSTWFSVTYWRVAALAAMLTLPFLCAAAVQAVARADMTLLARAAFGYLPLSVLGVSLAAPLTMLALAATDRMSAVVSADAARGGARFLDAAARSAVAIAGSGISPFFAVVVGLLAVMAALALATELLIRAAAVYVVVLMLPLAFAALVWPARRAWAARLVELLASLILSKFVIVAVLSLAGAAFAAGPTGVSELLVAMTLLLLSTFAPWALMRILPFTEIAAGAAGVMRGELHGGHGNLALATGAATSAAGHAMELPGRLHAYAQAGMARRADPLGTAGDPEPGTEAVDAVGTEQPAEDPGQPAGGWPQPAEDPARPAGAWPQPPEERPAGPGAAQRASSRANPASSASDCVVTLPRSPRDGLKRLEADAILRFADPPDQPEPAADAAPATVPGPAGGPAPEAVLEPDAGTASEAGPPAAASPSPPRQP